MRAIVPQANDRSNKRRPPTVFLRSQKDDPGPPGLREREDSRKLLKELEEK
jgi:hypothetical protein